MPSLLILIFTIEVAVELINTIGAATINNLLWRIFNALPTKLSAQFAEQRKLQQDYLKVRRELNATSSQDEFAKWAKLRRQHDKLLEQLEKKKAALDSTKGNFDKYITGIRWVGTQGLRYFLPFWYAKVPMFWLPYGWFPYYAEWLVSFPRAPMGSVSIASWQLACTGFVVLIKDAITALVVFGLGMRKSKVKQAVPVKVASGEKGSDEKAKAASTTTEKEGKKEL
ncbi:GET complex subunit get1 [Pyricularia grisea]|nr:GET complex subunit get1 [Pyricularia grisea]